MTLGHWEHTEHGADIGVRGVGETLAEAFRQAALALTALITPLERVEANESVRIERRESDRELLFYDWLNAVIYEMAIRGMLFSRFDIAIENGELLALAQGEPADPIRHRPAVEIKGATMTGLKVVQGDDGLWTAECVVDV